MTVDHDLDALVHAADLDGLVRMIDARSTLRDWEGVLRVRDRARAAVATGRQLWPAATLAEYRVALHGPAPLVAAVLDESDGLSGRFTIGPLTEVAAQGHTWAELAPHLPAGPRASIVAHERALRGEPVDASALPAVFDIPARLGAWEPSYPLATYRDDGAEFPTPDLSTSWIVTDTASAPRPAPLEDTDDVRLAVEQLVEPWTTASNGQVDVVAVESTVDAAMGALGVGRARVGSITPATAIAWLAWAGASGGAHGRRRGAAAGRFGAWWVLAALGDLLDDWPVEPDALGDLAGELRWYRWDAFEPAVGWSLRIAVEDPVDGLAWAIAATDAV